MTIETSSHLDPIQPGKKPGRNDQVRGGDKTDTINLSSEAREKAEIYQVVELIKSAPELSTDRIAELREKVNDPAYINDRIINATADRIMEAFGI
jgi:negative regulator of flagellin synthesis FlgM